MKVEFNEELKARTIAFCDDELNYHINESDCAEEYHGETCAEIELLYRLGEEDAARSYKKQYLATIKELIKNEKDQDYKKDLKEMVEDFHKFWDNLDPKAGKKVPEKTR